MRAETEAVFDEEHPAPALRFKEQLKQLTTDGWWRIVKEPESKHVTLINRLASKTKYQFVFRDSEVAGFVEAFLSIVPSIHTLVREITPDTRTATRGFRLCRTQIEDCLLHG